jgi:NAD-dependent dihydropyrimidine dehydrogenase PreA subunit
LSVEENLRFLMSFAFRLIPYPAVTGLKVFGKPDKSSPVFLTANFDLTVRRVEKYLKDLDCYLLVAQSKGINVWCAACGDSFSARSVISIIKITRINHKVRHRRLILPQLAAPGIDLKQVQKATGWQKILSWLVLLAVSLATYLLISGDSVSGYIVGLFSGAIVAVILIGLDFGGIAPTTKSDLDPLIVKLGFSNKGDILKSDNPRIRLILGIERINLDASACIGCGVCQDICPVGAYRLDDQQRKSVMDCPSRCTACTACVMQCPTGAVSIV